MNKQHLKSRKGTALNDIQYFRSPPCFTRKTMLCRRVIGGDGSYHRRERLAASQPSVELATVCCEELSPPRTPRRDCHTQVARQPSWPPPAPPAARPRSPEPSLPPAPTPVPSAASLRLGRSSGPFYRQPDLFRIDIEEDDRRARRWSLKRAFADLLAFLGLGRRAKSPERPRRFELRKAPHDLGQRNVGLLFFKEGDGERRPDYRGRRFHVRRRTFTMRDERVDVACDDGLSRELMDREYRQRLLRQLRQTRVSCPLIS